VTPPSKGKIKIIAKYFVTIWNRSNILAIIKKKTSFRTSKEIRRTQSKNTRGREAPVSTLEVNTITDADGTGAPEFTLGLEAATGSAADPSISFLGDVNTGLYQDTTNSIAIAINGVRHYRFDTTGGFLFPTGTAALPSIGFLNDRDTGFFNPTTNALGIAVGGSERVRFDTNGSVHFGISLGNSSATVGVIISETVRHAAIFRNTNPSLVGGIVQFRFDTTGGTSARFWEGVEAAGSSPNFTARVDTDGTFRSDISGTITTGASGFGGFQSTGADYAEFFEWLDGNPNLQDRIGCTVSITNGKIEIANPGDEVIGVVSAFPSVVGDSYMSWPKKYIKDEFGRRKKSGDGKPLLNPEWDSTKEYVLRSKRREWAAIGLMGKLKVKKGQQINPKWIKIRDVSDQVEEWLVR
jgi:hypothetical protein